MVNPLTLFSVRQWSSNPHRTARRRVVPVPTSDTTEGAIFLVLRRLRLPIVLIIVAFSLCVIGLSLVPGTGANGQPKHLSLFDAFYVISYTATTIGFGEIPYPFSVPQRLWVTGSIYLTVITWAYAVGSMLSLVQDGGFRDAIATQRFRRRVKSMAEPFVILCGYGETGRKVGAGLDAAGHSFVAIDGDGRRVEKLLSSVTLAQDAPGVEGDASIPTTLGLAGLSHPRCSGVLAITNDDKTNLGIVMAANLLRPEIPVIARCHDKRIEGYMHSFGVDEVINPNDRFGAYLLLAMHRPEAYRLVTWLLSPPHTPLKAMERVEVLGPWVVVGDDAFTDEFTSDLREAGIYVRNVDPDGTMPPLDGAGGFVAATDSDTINLALAEQARLACPGVFVVVRQHGADQKILAEALDVDSVFVPTSLVARDVLARVVTPHFRSFIDEVVHQDDEWASDVIGRIVGQCGRRNPRRDLVKIDMNDAPAVVRWLAFGRKLTLHDLLRDPDDRDRLLPTVALMVLRADGERLIMPDLDTPLMRGDQLLLAGQGRSFTDLTEALYYDAALWYAVTGEAVPSTWLWRTLSRRVRRVTASTDVAVRAGSQGSAVDSPPKDPGDAS